MKWVAPAAGVILALVPAAGTAQSNRFTILAEGTTSCGEWIDKRKAEPDRVLPEAAWVLGYLTASSAFRPARIPDFTKGVEGSATDHWVDNYCATHPLDNIQTAAQSLAAELVQRVQGISN